MKFPTRPWVVYLYLYLTLQCCMISSRNQTKRYGEDNRTKGSMFKKHSIFGILPLPRSENYCKVSRTDYSESGITFGLVLYSCVLDLVRMLRIQTGAVIQWMNDSSTLRKVDWTLGCVFIRWSALDEIGRTVSKDAASEYQVKAREWVGMQQMEILMVTVHLVRANQAIQCCSGEITWSHHRFYLNQFQKIARQEHIGISWKIEDICNVLLGFRKDYYLQQFVEDLLSRNLVESRILPTML